MKPEDAIYQACLLRFRPIMMTTMAALLGAVPLALGSGSGSELRRPLGITIIGGLLISQLLTLYTTPVIYIWFDRLAQRISPRPESQQGPCRRRTGSGGVSDEYFGTLHPEARRHHASFGRDYIGRRGGIPAASGVAAASGGLSDHLRERRFAWGKSRDDGLLRGHAAGAAIRTNCVQSPR